MAVVFQQMALKQDIGCFCSRFHGCTRLAVRFLGTRGESSHHPFRGCHDIAGIGFLAVFVIVGEEGVYPSG